MRDAAAQIRDWRFPIRLFAAVTGGGTGLQDVLWSQPGISSCFAGAICTYAADASDDFLGYRPESYCSADMATDLAMSAYVRARESLLAEPDGSPERLPVGLGLTASVASAEEHRGDHRAFATVVTSMGAQSWLLILPKGAGVAARAADGEICDRLAMNAILETLGIPQIPFRPDHASPDAFSGSIVHRRGEPTFTLRPNTEIHPDQMRALFFKRPVFSRSGLRRRTEDLDVANLAFLPASLNPPHEGHRRMAEVVEQERRKRVVYTVTADSRHKPTLTVPEMLDRVAAVRRQRWEARGARTVVFTQGDPLFLDKARRWPSAEFVVGADTVLRMLDPHWGIEPEALLHELQGLGARFLVFGREVSMGDMPPVFVPAPMVLRDLPFDARRFAEMFVPMPGRWDVSSTAIHRRAMLAMAARTVPGAP